MITFRAVDLQCSLVAFSSAQALGFNEIEYIKHTD